MCTRVEAHLCRRCLHEMSSRITMSNQKQKKKRLSRRQLAILHAFLALTVDPEAQGVCCESDMLAYLHGDTERGFDAPTKREAKAILLSELQTEVEDMVTRTSGPSSARRRAGLRCKKAEACPCRPI